MLAHELLDELGIEAHIKTSGSRGLHLYVALEPRWDSYEVRAAAVALARELERRHPDRITAAWWKEERGSRVFVDFNQNAPHKTVFGAWCARPRVGAQVSTPITWDELADRRARRAHHRDRARRASPSAATRGPACTTDRRTSRRCSSGPPTTSPTGSGRAVAARVPEDAARAAEGRSEPRPRNLTRGSRSRSAVRSA